MCIVPYRLKVVADLNLSIEQKLLLKHDLHFSHKSHALMDFCKENHIVLLYVPARCTDVLQECDVVINSPFKAALKKCFRDWLDAKFNAHLAAGNTALTFKLTYGELKPLLPGWIDSAIAALRTPDMKETIARSFERDGCFGIMRSPDGILLGRERLAREEENVVVPDGEEVDVDHIDDMIAFDNEFENALLTAGEVVLEDDEEDKEKSDSDSENDESSESSEESCLSAKFGRWRRVPVPNTKYERNQLK